MAMAHKVAFCRYAEVKYPPKPAADKTGTFPADPELEARLFSNTEGSGINFDDYDNIPVEVVGKNVPGKERNQNQEPSKELGKVIFFPLFSFFFFTYSVSCIR